MTDFPTFDVVFAMTGDVYRNARALKQVHSLTRLGLRTMVLAVEGTTMRGGLPDGVQVRTMPLPTGRGPAFFRDIHRGMSDMLRVVNARHVHASDLYVLTACSRRAHELGARLSYDARELYAHVAATARRPWVSWVWRMVEGRSIRKANTVFTVSDHIADHLRDTYGIRRPLVVHNVPDRRLIHPEGVSTVRERLPGIGNAPLVLHLGQMRASRGLSHLIRAMTHFPEGHLVFMGYGLHEKVLTAERDALGLSDRIHFLPPVAPADVVMASRDADIGVTLLEDTCLNHRYALPNKLFDYFEAGLPVVASDLPEIAAVLASHDAGLTADPADHAALGSTLAQAVSESTRLKAGAERASKAFTWEVEEPVFASAFAHLT